MSKFHVLALHGIGQQEEGYSKALRSGVIQRLKKAKAIKGNADLAWLELHWWTEPVNKQERLYQAVSDVQPRQPWWKIFLRGSQLGDVLEDSKRFVVSQLGDILSYDNDSVRQGVRQRIEDLFREFGTDHGADEPISVSFVAHSLGSVVMFDYLVSKTWGDSVPTRDISSLSDETLLLPENQQRDDPAMYLSSVFTLGSPLVLFTLRADDRNYPGYYAKCIPFLHRSGGRWINFLDRRDPVAFPIENIFGRRRPSKGQLQHRYLATDKIVDNGADYLTAHSRYWGNGDVATEIVNIMLPGYIPGGSGVTDI